MNEPIGRKEVHSLVMAHIRTACLPSHGEEELSKGINQHSILAVGRYQITLAAALSYAERGWAVVPVWGIENGRCACGKHNCTSPGKHPIVRDWVKRASCDPAVIHQWLKKWPSMNIAIATGSRSNLFVLDSDGPEGEASLLRLIAQYGELPATLTAQTGRGRHLFFKYPGRRVKPTAGVLGTGLDVRGDGGCIIAPPSVHMNGKNYEWIDSAAEISEAPAWLIAFVCGDEEIQQISAEPAHNAVIEEGSRNLTLFRRGCAMRGEGATAEQIEAELIPMNQQSCSPPLPPAEVNVISISCAKYPPGRGPRTLTITGDDGGLKWIPIDIPTWKRNEHVFAMKDYQVGWYIWLILECWDRGGYLPNDSELLARLARATKPGRFKAECSVVLAEFELSEDESQLVHPGLRAEYESRAEKVEKKRYAAQQRWAKKAEPEAETQAEEGYSHAS